MATLSLGASKTVEPFYCQIPYTIILDVTNNIRGKKAHGNIGSIHLKRAIRKFTPDPLPEETILAILNAGRRAQSSKNTQPWQSESDLLSPIAITEKAILKDLSECGQVDSEGRSNTWHLAGAALGVALLTEDPTERLQRLFDLGQATTHVL